MTMAAVGESERPQSGGGMPSSLMAQNRSTQGGSRAPTRERVSEAIALVRARQAAESSSSSHPTATTLQDVRSNAVAMTNDYNEMSKQLSQYPVGDNSAARSPLVPAGQTGSYEMKRRHHQHQHHYHHHSKQTAASTPPNSFLMNVFASRSDVASGTTPDEEEDEHVDDEREENIPMSTATSSSRFINPLEFVKREIQLATQSASHGRVATSIGSKSDHFSTDVMSPSGSSSRIPTMMQYGDDDIDSADSNSEMAVDEQMKRDIGNFLDRLNVRAAASTGEDSVESFEIPVDAKTIEEVNTFLYSLNIKEPNELHSVLEQVACYESDPIGAMRSASSDDVIVAMRSAASEDIIGAMRSAASDDVVGAMRSAASDDVIYDGSNNDDDEVHEENVIFLHDAVDVFDVVDHDEEEEEEEEEGDVGNGADDDSFSHRSVKQEELEEEIGAYIDAINKDHDDGGVEVKKQHQDAPTFQDPVMSATSWQSETQASKDVSFEDRDALSYLENEGQIEIVQNESTESDDVEAQTRVSKPSPIYEQVEAKSLPRGSHKDPPAAITSRNTDQVDPPAKQTVNMNEAVMRMHESQPVAPSYSVESLESDGMILDHHKGAEEETKADDDNIVDQQASKTLDPVVEASSAETDSSEEKVEGQAGNADGKDYDKLLEEALRSKEAPAVVTSIQIEADEDTSDEVGLKKGLPPTPREQAERSSPSKVAIAQSSEASTSSELLDDAGVPLRAQLSADGSDLEDGRASQLVGRYDTLEANSSDDDIVEANRSEEKNSREENGGDDDDDDDEVESQSSDIVTDLPVIGLQDLPNSPSMKDDDSIPWDLKDIASEETMKAAGRTRPAALNPASRSKARKLTSILTDDSSVPQSEAEGSRVEDETEAAEQTEEVPPATTTTPGFAFDECVIEDGGEEGVEVMENGIQNENEEEEGEKRDEDSATDDEADADAGAEADTESEAEEEEDVGAKTKADADADADAETEAFSPEDIPPVPTTGSEDHRESLSVDPFGHLGSQIDPQEDEAKDKRPDPETDDGKPDLGEDVDDDFVEAFLQQGSRSADNVEENESNKKVAEITTDSNPSLQSHWYNPFSSSSKEKTADEEGPGFLEQFQSLEIDNEEENDHTARKDGFTVDSVEVSSEAAVKAPRNLFTLAGIARFFAALDEQFGEGSGGSMAQNVIFFQGLVAPVLAGEKPSIIGAAQIRQAAMRADVPLEVVDRFLDLVDEQQQPQVQSDLIEDAAISAFLTRFGALRDENHSFDANAWMAEEYVRTEDADDALETNDDADFVDDFVEELQIQESDQEDDVEWWMDQEKKKNGRKMQKSQSVEIGSVDKIIGVESDGQKDYTGHDELIESLAKPSISPPLSPSPSTVPSPTERAVNLQPRSKPPRLILNKLYTSSYENGEGDEWSRRNNMAQYGAGWEAHANWLSPKANSKPRRIDGVAAAENMRRFVFSKKIFKNHQPWRKLYRERTQYHPGFLEVDVHSIYESTAVDLTLQREEEEEYIPWERREVKQRFLQEKSYSFARNWFGEMARKRGNQKIKAPVCKPKSMEMPIENLPDQGEWTKEWFTQWKSPALRRRASSDSKSEDYTTDGSYTDGETLGDHGSTTDQGSVTDRGTFTDHGSVTDRGTFTTDHGTTDHGYTDHGSYTDGSTTRRNYDESSFSASERTGSSGDSGSTASWEEAPECGEIINVRQKIGERVTRVHPDFTSSLHRSRWRKKYFPGRTFPY